MDACDRIRDFDRASQWSTRIREAAARWQLPALITVCRPHYAVVLTWHGLWDEAGRELEAAIEEYGRARPLMTAEGIVRLAELRLRQGKIDEAAQLFSRVEHEGLAQVGLAELALARDDATSACDLAARFLRRIPASDRVERAPGLDVLARAALAGGDIELAEGAALELRESADAGNGLLRCGGGGPTRSAGMPRLRGTNQRREVHGG